MKDDEEIKEAEENNSIYKFTPPVYFQRYEMISNILEDAMWSNKIQKVVDFGCAELHFFKFMKNLNNITSILEVDFDKPLLERYHTRVEPLIYNYIVNRPKTLDVSILHGSVCDPDYRLLGCDAVICIELIEHLDPGVLDRLPHNIFGFIEPLLVFITTPNVEFNTFFPQLKNGGFRHYDHRFEWTRKQFEEWGSNVVSRYPNYTVEYYGIGSGPEETESLGCCSQMAFFVHKNYNKKSDVHINTANKTTNDTNNSEQDIKSQIKWDNINWEDFGKPCDIYSIVAEYQYPSKIDSRTEDQKLTDEAISRIHLYTSHECPFYNDEKYHWEIPLKNLLLFNSSLNVDLNMLGENLKSRGYNVVENSLIYEDKPREGSDEETCEDQNEICVTFDETPVEDECW